MAIYDVDEAAQRLEELLDRALAGEEVIITVNGVPKVKLVPIEPAPEES